MILRLIGFLEIKFPLNKISLLFFQIVGTIGGIEGFLLGFLFKWLKKFAWLKKLILRLIVSIFCSSIVGDFINFSGIFVILRTPPIPDVTTKMALFLAAILTLIGKLFMVIIHSIILLIMLKVYDKYGKIVEKE